MNKHIIFILYLLGMSLTGHSQQVFNNTYDDNFRFNGLQCVYENDDFYFAGGSSNYCSLCQVESYLIKTDKSGVLIDQLNFRVGTGRNNVIAKIIEKNEKIYLLGNYIDTLEHPNIGYNSFIYVTNNNFDSLYLDTLNLGFYDRLIDILPFKEGFLLLGFVYDNIGIDSSLIALCHIDTFANVIETKYFGSSGYDFAYDFKATNDGGFIIGGETDDFPAFSPNQLFLLKLDSNLNEEWYQEFGDIQADERIRTYNYVELSADGGYFFGAELSTGQTGTEGAALLYKLNSFGDLEDVDTIQYQPRTNLKNIHVWKDSFLIVSGGVVNYENPVWPFHDPRGYLAKYAANGEHLIWQRYFSKWWGNPVNSDYVHESLLTRDGGILVSGYQTHDVPTLNDSWLIKFDSCGYTADNPTQAEMLVDSILGFTAYISNLSQDYCTGYLLITDSQGNFIDSISIYAYSQWTSGANPEQLIINFPDTGNYSLFLSVTGGDQTDTLNQSIVIENPVSSNKEKHSDNLILKVFPNPAQDFFIVEMINSHLPKETVVNCTVINSLGKVVETCNLRTDLYQQRVNLGDLNNNGVYFLRFTLNDSIVSTDKLTVVH